MIPRQSKSLGNVLLLVFQMRDLRSLGRVRLPIARESAPSAKIGKDKISDNGCATRESSYPHRSNDVTARISQRLKNCRVQLI